MAINGDYTRSGFFQMFDEAKEYISLRAQKLKPMTDADLNDVTDALYTQIRRVSEAAFGSAAAISDGFMIDEASTTENNFLVTGGGGDPDSASRVFVNGFRCLLENDVDYTSASHRIHSSITGLTDTVLTDDSANWGVNELTGRELQANIDTSPSTFTILSNTQTTITVASGLSSVSAVGDYYRVELSTPVGARSDLVYLDVFPDEIDSDEDSDLIHSLYDGVSPVSVECALRVGVRHVVHVREGSTTLPTNFTDSIGRPHYYMALAELNRTATDDILSADIEDVRNVLRYVRDVGDGLEFTSTEEISVLAADDSVGVSSVGIASSVLREEVLPAQVANSDDDPVSASTLAGEPASDSKILLTINGMAESISYGAKTASFYFSGDGGTTARALGGVSVGDTLHIVVTNAGYTIDATDEIKIYYTAV